MKNVIDRHYNRKAQSYLCRKFKILEWLSNRKRFALSAEDFSQNKSEIDQRSAIVDAKFEVINNSMGEIHEKLAKLTVAMNSFSDLYIHEIE